MGSPALAVAVLERMVAAGHQVPLVVTQVASRAGRGLHESQPAVALAARSMGLPVFQPKAIRSQRTRERIREAQPDIIVVAAYGRILPREILEIPPLACLNVHLSLLPRHRGAAPVSGAILAGDRVTGVSIMAMEEGLDTGPVLAQAPRPIIGDDDQLSLTERLGRLGADLLVDLLPRWAAGAVTPQPQDESKATWTHPTQRSDAGLDWNQPAVQLWRKVRAYAEWPIAFTTWNGKLLRILKADYQPAGEVARGTVAALGQDRRARSAAIGTARGSLIPRLLGIEGKKAAPIDVFLQGYPGFIGATLGSPGGRAL